MHTVWSPTTFSQASPGGCKARAAPLPPAQGMHSIPDSLPACQLACAPAVPPPRAHATRLNLTAKAPSVPWTWGSMASAVPSGVRQAGSMTKAGGGGSRRKVPGWRARKAATCCSFSSASMLQETAGRRVGSGLGWGGRGRGGGRVESGLGWDGVGRPAAASRVATKSTATAAVSLSCVVVCTAITLELTRWHAGSRTHARRHGTTPTSQGAPRCTCRCSRLVGCQVHPHLHPHLHPPHLRPHPHRTCRCCRPTGRQEPPGSRPHPAAPPARQAARRGAAAAAAAAPVPVRRSHGRQPHVNCFARLDAAGQGRAPVTTTPCPRHPICAHPRCPPQAAPSRPAAAPSLLPPSGPCAHPHLARGGGASTAAVAHVQPQLHCPHTSSTQASSPAPAACISTHTSSKL